jgi:enoyl-[acyl-carrier protein] reductase I
VYRIAYKRRHEALQEGSAVIGLAGKRGLVVGIANADSIAYGAARALVEGGAELAVTYLNEKAEPHVRPLAERLGAGVLAELDVTRPETCDAVFRTLASRWGSIDFLVHAVAFAPAADLRGRVTDCSAEGFAQAMHISCYSLIDLTRRAEALMTSGGSIVTMSFLGAERVVAGYGMMGPVKAALQATTRYLAAELGPAGIRVHALSSGPIRTRAASGLKDIDALVADTVERAPLHRPVTIDEVGAVTAFLASDAAAALTGETLYVDAGRHVVA